MRFGYERQRERERECVCASVLKFVLCGETMQIPVTKTVAELGDILREYTRLQGTPIVKYSSRHSLTYCCECVCRRPQVHVHAKRQRCAAHALDCSGGVFSRK